MEDSKVMDALLTLKEYCTGRRCNSCILKRRLANGEEACISRAIDPCSYPVVAEKVINWIEK